MLLFQYLQAAALLALTLVASLPTVVASENEVNYLENLEELNVQILEGEYTQLIQFCAKGEEKCQKMANQYGVLSALFKGLVEFYVVDMETDGGMDIVNKYSIPTDSLPVSYTHLTLPTICSV